ncbi:MAG: GWxTD domain-containing protein [Ignavibacteriaceae bacterium]|nr:GWxTD domain-containing protein [Ignavibacteriaceae bacterium]
MKKIFTTIWVLFFFTVVLAQPDRTDKEIKFSSKTKFFEEYLCFISADLNKTRVDVFIQVPYSEIQFVKVGNGFESKYNLTVSIFDEDKNNLITEKTWGEKIVVKDFNQTTSKSNYNLSMKSFNLEPGKYNIRTAFEDIDSRKEYSIENIFNVRKLESAFSISDVMLISKQTIVDGSNKIIPNVSRNVAAKKDGIPFFFELYSSAPREIKISYSILEDAKNGVYNEELSKHIDSGRTQIFHTIKDVDLGLGNYLLSVKVSDNQNDLTANSNKTFVSRWMGVPSSIRDLDKAVSQMLYIATSSEIDEIESAKSKEDKIQKYLEYWKKKDPDPQSDDNPVFDEYYRRVAFSNENFSHYVEGWRTDRGMVYIILGAPNNIDRHPFEYDSKPYEVWEYYELNKSFVFLDETGFGDYRLITPLYGDFFRYRN